MVEKALIVTQFIFGLYVFCMCVNAAAKMDNGDAFCWVAKYFASAMAGLWLMIRVFQEPFSGEIWCFGLVMFLFFWTQTAKQLRDIWDEIGSALAVEEEA